LNVKQILNDMLQAGYSKGTKVLHNFCTTYSQLPYRIAKS